MPVTASTSHPPTTTDGTDLDAPPDTLPVPAVEVADVPPEDPRTWLTHCDGCPTAVPADDTITTLAGAQICPTCQREDYWCCPDCGGWNPLGHPCGNHCDEDDEDDDDDDDDADDEDDDGYGASGRLIHGYGYKPYPVFHGTGPLFLGLELEVATPRDRWEPARLADRHLGSLGYLKADDSIGGGFELVTHPMTYPWALDHFPWPLLPALAQAGCQATERCGLHVHLSRTGFTSPAHVYRWMTLIHRNQTPVTALARRDSHEWARFDHDDRHHTKDYAKGAPGIYRYRAINTQNPHTFELRIFASSLQAVQVQAALGFAAATVDYTRTLTIPAITRHGGWTWPAFTDWLATRSQYVPLLDQVRALTGTRGGASCVC